MPFSGQLMALSRLDTSHDSQSQGPNPEGESESPTLFHWPSGMARDALAGVADKGLTYPTDVLTISTT